MFSISYTDRFGKDKSWQIASRHSVPKCVSGEFDTPDAVVIVPFHETKKKLVVIAEYRVAIGGFQYGFPAGLIDKGETIAQAGSRELTEETGLHVTAVEKTGPPVYSSTGMTDESVAMLYVSCEGEPSRAGNEGSEDIRTEFVSPQEAARLLSDAGQKFDVKTWLVLSFFAATGRLW